MKARMNSIMLFLGVIGVVVIYSCKSINSTTNVLGGVRTFEYSNVVRIHMSKGEGEESSGSCTASIVSDNTLLTAAHCLNDPNDTWVAVNINDKVYGTSVFRYHESFEYDRTKKDKKQLIYDIGVVVFDSGIFSKLDKTTISKELPFVGRLVRLVGFGRYTHQAWWSVNVTADKEKSGYKRTGTNFVSKREDCPLGMIEIKRMGDEITDAQIDKHREAYHSKDVTVTAGDSGGPLLNEHNGELYGIASFGSIEHACYSSPLFEPNLSFLRRMVLDPKIKASIPEINNYTPMTMNKFQVLDKEL